MQFFYDPTLTPGARECILSKSESNHLIRVLRKKVGDEIHLTNGQGYVFKGEISDPSVHACKIEIREEEKTIQKMHSLHLAVAPTKNSDRYEWFLEKATEIGIDEITPIICEHSERKVLKPHRLEKVIQSAMKQSLRSVLPILNDPVPFEEFMKKDFTPWFKYIAHCQEGERQELKRRATADKDILILIGPEGDFSDAEIDLAVNNGFMPVSMGEYRLRTETAAILACATVAFVNTR